MKDISYFALSCFFLSNYAVTALQSSLEDRRELAGRLYLAAWVEEVNQDWQEEGEARRVVAGHSARELAAEGGSQRSVREAVGLLVSSLFTSELREKRPELAWAETRETEVPGISEIASHAGSFLSLYRTDLDRLVWLLGRHRDQQWDLAFQLLSVGSNLDLDMMAFLLASLISQEEGGEVTEEQRRWWRLAASADQLQLTSQDQIVLQHGRDVIRCSGAHGLQPSFTSKLAAAFQAGGEDEEVRGRAGLYYRASLDTIAVLERGETVGCPTVRLFGSADTLVSAAQMTEMKAQASQFLGVKEAQAEEIQSKKSQPVKSQVEESRVVESKEEESREEESREEESREEERQENNNNNTKIVASTQTESEGASVKSLVDSAEERLGEKISQLRLVVEDNSGILAQILPLIQNIQKEMKELRREAHITAAPAVPLPPVEPSTSRLSVASEKPGDEVSQPEQEEIPGGDGERESSAEKENEKSYDEDGNKVIEEENKIEDDVEKVGLEKENGEDQKDMEELPAAPAVPLPPVESPTSQLSVSTEKPGDEGSHPEQEVVVVTGGDGKEEATAENGNEKSKDKEETEEKVWSERETNQDVENNNFDIREKKGRKREAGKVVEADGNPRFKKKKVLKKISREEEEDDLMPSEEKVVHRQKARLSVLDGGGWEERGRGDLKLIKNRRTGELRLEMRGTQYGEVCLSQLLSQQVLNCFVKSGATAWRWRDPRMREQYQLTLDTQRDSEKFKKKLDENSGTRTLLGFIQNFSAWYWN